MKVDLYDKKILYELDCNSRVSASSIGKKIKLPKETVNYRIKRLQENKYINRFYAIFNGTVMGYRYYKIFFKFTKLDERTEKNIINYLRCDSSCTNLRLIEGQYTVVFLSAHRSLGRLRKFLQKFTDLYGNYILDKEVSMLAQTHKINQKFFIEGSSTRKNINHEEIGTYVPDATDIKIILLLSINARIKLNEIADKIKVDAKLIRYRIKRMEKKGIIVAYAISLNPEKLNREFVQIDINIKNRSSIPSMIEFFDNTNTCVFAYELIGKYDLSVELYIEHDDSLRRIMEKFRDKFFDSYIYYDISHVYRDYVINWSPFSLTSNSKKVNLI